MNKTVAALVCLSPLVVCACGDSEPEGPVEAAVAVQLPLTAECGQCAASSLSTTCQAEVQACASDPFCMDVAGCVQSCAPQDLQCFAQCAESSVPFTALIECVVCDKCAPECGPGWACSGDPQETDPPTPPDPEDPPNPGGNLEACGYCILQGSTNECAELGQACLANGECVEAAECIASCGLTVGCATQCTAGASEETKQLLEELWVCATTSPCTEECLGSGDGDPGDPGGSNACLSCAQDAAEVECHDLAVVCQSTPGCVSIATCVSQCSDAQCAEACFVGEEAAIAAAEELALCAVCDVCAGICPTTACPL